MSIIGQLFEVLLIGLPALLVLACIRLVKRSGGIATVLLLIGSIAFLIDQTVTLILSHVLLPYVATHLDGIIRHTLWPTCTQHPAFVHAHHILIGVGWISLSVGLVWFCLRFTRRT